MYLWNEIVFNEVLRTQPFKMSPGERMFIKIGLTYEEKEEAIADNVYPAMIFSHFIPSIH